MLAIAAVLALALAVPAATPAPALAHRNVGATSPVAAHAFDEGLTALYAFAPEVARAEFQAAAAAEPALAAAYWGIALSYGPNINEDYSTAGQSAAAKAIARAQSLKRGARPADAVLIDAAAARYRFRGPGDRDRAARAYFDAMAKAAAAFPNDADILTLAGESALELNGWRWWNADGKPTEGVADGVAWLEAARALDPVHLGANHFLIHIYEESPDPSRAISSAKVLDAAVLPPYAEHLAHMPAHAYMRTGDYHEAGAANLRALKMEATAPDVYVEHDVAVGYVAYMMSGERARALELTRYSQNAAFERGHVDVRFNRCTEGDVHDAQLGDFTRAVCSARLGNLPQAQRLLHDLAGRPGNAQQPQLTLAQALVESEITRAQGDMPGRIAALQRAVNVQDALGYDEPPHWFFPVRESLGAALLAAGRADDAKAVFERDLQQNPENPRSLFGLAQAERALGRSDDAARTQARFELAWSHADGPLALSDL